MSSEAIVSNENRLTIVFRVEPGCLGPDGKQYIDEFCALVQRAFAQKTVGSVSWEIIPRYDKQLPETEYRLGERGFSRDKAQRFLAACGKDLDTLENKLNLALPRMIEQYLARE